MNRIKVQRSWLAWLVLLVSICVSNNTLGETYTCDSCSSCSSAVQGAATGDTVTLTTNIETAGESRCIDFDNATGILFYGGDHTISRGSSGSRGIEIYSGSGNTITNVEVRGFSQGVYWAYSSNNAIRNSRIIGNTNGIEFYSAGSNLIEDTLVSHNGIGIYLTYNSDNNIIRQSSIIKNNVSGLTFFPRLSSGDPENNQIYNNILSNTSNGNINVTTISTEEDRDLSAIPFIFNSPLDCSQDTNIMGCGCTGGNYWQLPLGQGFSENCTDGDSNGICDTAYTLPHGTAVMVDHYPLTVPPAGCCANADRDADGFTHALCGGNDHDDDPLSCGASCHPGALEVCDGFDNDGDGIADGTIACADMMLSKKALLDRPVADQSCVTDPVSGKIFCFGGRSYGSPSYLDTITTYNPGNDSVQVLAANLPTARSRLSCAYAPSTARMYCFGGYRQETICTKWDDNGNCISAYAIVYRYNDILEFNPTDESITDLPVSLPANMEGMSSVWNDQTETIFIAGGTSSIHAGNRDSILEFNPTNLLLTEKAAHLPSARYSHSSAVDSGTGLVYFFGGYGADGGLSEIVAYNPETDSIAVKNSSFPSTYYDAACVEDSVDHLVYCLAGKYDNSNLSSSIFVYDPGADTLAEQTASFVSNRFRHSCTENPSTNKIYCFGGSQNVVNISGISEYTPSLPILGDINNDTNADLTDLIVNLQQSIGDTGTNMNRKADIGGNRQLGLEEAEYILRVNGGL